MRTRNAKTTNEMTTVVVLDDEHDGDRARFQLRSEGRSSTRLTTSSELLGIGRVADAEVLRAQVVQLQIQLNECLWATERAKELGAALAVLTEENALLKRKVESLEEANREMHALRQVQRLLLRVADDGQQQPPPPLSSSSAPGAGASSSTTAIASRSYQNLLLNAAMTCEALQNKFEAVARWGSSVCPSCLVAKEKSRREELVLREQTAWSQIQSRWDDTFRVQQYSTEQMTMMETERMWEEDMRAHRMANERLQRELSRRESAEATMKVALDEASHWKRKFFGYKEVVKERMFETLAERDGAREQVSQLAARAAPPTTLLRSLYLSSIKTHYAYGRVMCQMGLMRKQLLLLRVQCRDVRSVVKKCVAAIFDELQETLLQLTVPLEWQSVTKLPGGGGGGGGPTPHPPMWIPAARNLIIAPVTSSASSLQKRKLQQPQIRSNSASSQRSSSAKRQTTFSYAL